MEKRVVTSLTKHFVERWRLRVGTEPSLEEVSQLIEKGVRIRNQKLLLEPVTLREFVVLAEYLSLEAGCVILVDVKNRCAVTVISGRNTDPEGTIAHEEPPWRTDTPASAWRPRLDPLNGERVI